MAASNGFPNLTTAGQGLFAGASSAGYIQGQAQPDPATRFALRAGIVSQAETLPMWGGLAVSADISPISASGPAAVLGQVLKRATSLATIDGFTVFDQSYNLVTDPSNPVPTAGSGQSINYYPIGCRARIAVPCDPALINLRGGAINQQVSWDYAAGLLVPYAAPYSSAVITGAVWAATGGGRITFTVGTDLTASLNAGDWIDTAGIVQTGGTGGSFNGSWKIISINATTIVVTALAAAGYYGTYGSAGTVVAGGGALPVTVLDVQPTGNITVGYVGGAAVYNYNGSIALIQLTGGTVA